MIAELIREMAKVNDGDPERVGHALKVLGYARCITGCEQADEHTQQITQAAAVLHDIAIRHCEQAFGSCGGKLQEQHGPAIARPILEKYTDDNALIDRVCFLIAHHHTYDGIDGLDYRALVEADFLVNAEEGNIPMQAFWAALANYFDTQTGKALTKTLFGTPKLDQ